MQESGSEVAQLRQKIAAEYMAAKLGLQGLNTGTSRHEFITARQERMGVLHEQLQGLVGDVAIVLVAETLDSLPDTAARSDVLMVFRHELGNSEETERLCADLQEVWKVVDMLRDRFGVEPARKVILAPSSSLREIPPS